jgi:predicted RNA-binding protein with TRAM domain
LKTGNVATARNKQIFPSETRSHVPAAESRHYMPEFHKGDKLMVYIEAYGPTKAGIGYIGDYKIVVPRTEVGEIVNAQVRDVHGTTVHAMISGEREQGNLY